MENPIKILIIGNKDTNKEQFIELMSSYGEVPFNATTPVKSTRGALELLVTTSVA